MIHVSFYKIHYAKITILETPKGVFPKGANPDQMPQDTAADTDLHYFANTSAIFQQEYLNEHNLTPLRFESVLSQYVWQKSSFSLKWVQISSISDSLAVDSE